jgi:hypothetical protein
MNKIVNQLAQSAKFSKDLMEKYKTQVWEGEHAKINKKMNVGFAKRNYEYELELLEKYVAEHHLYSDYLEAIAYIEGIIHD